MERAGKEIESQQRKKWKQLCYIFDCICQYRCLDEVRVEHVLKLYSSGLSLLIDKLHRPIRFAMYLSQFVKNLQLKGLIYSAHRFLNKVREGLSHTWAMFLNRRRFMPGRRFDDLTFEMRFIAHRTSFGISTKRASRVLQFMTTTTKSYVPQRLLKVTARQGPAVGVTPVLIPEKLPIES